MEKEQNTIVDIITWCDETIDRNEFLWKHDHITTDQLLDRKHEARKQAAQDILELVEGCKPNRYPAEQINFEESNFEAGYNQGIDDYEQNLSNLKEK